MSEKVRARRFARAQLCSWSLFWVSTLLCASQATAQLPPQDRAPNLEPAEATVVLVRTRGPSAWIVAERRLAAELRSLQMDVVSEPIVRQVDEQLPERALEYDAFVAIQVMRNGDRGLVRLWFAEQGELSAGYQHVELNLRNPEVVSRAVLPSVEAIYDRARISLSEVNDAVDADGQDMESSCLDTGTDSDCRPRLSLRLGAGPWIVTAGDVTGFAGALGARHRLWSQLALDYELIYQVLNVPGEGASLRGMLLFRSHALVDLWAREGRGVGVGVGAGAVRGAAPGSPQGYHPLASARAVLFARASERLDVVFAVSGARALAGATDIPRGGWFTDVMLALDWHILE